MLRRRRAVCGEVAQEDARHDIVGLWNRPPLLADLVRPGERDPRPLARPEDDVALPRERLECRAPATAQGLTDMAEPARLRDFCDQVFARQRTAIEDLSGDDSKFLDLGRRQAEIALPDGPL